MKKTSLILCCAGCAFVTAAGIGASQLLAAGGKFRPVWAAVTTPELPGEAAAQRLVMDTVGDFMAVRHAHPLSETQRQQITATLKAYRDDVVLLANARLKRSGCCGRRFSTAATTRLCAQRHGKSAQRWWRERF